MSQEAVETFAAAHWNMLDDGERDRLVHNISGHFGEVTDEGVRRRSLD